MAWCRELAARGPARRRRPSRHHSLSYGLRLHRRLPPRGPRARRLGGERAAADARGRDAAVRAHPGAGGGVRARRRRGGGARRRPSGGGELPVRARHAARRRLRLGDPLYGGWRQPTHGGDASCFLRRRVLGQPRHGFLGPDPKPAQHFAGRVLGLGGSAARSARRACPDLDRAARLRPRRAPAATVGWRARLAAARGRAVAAAVRRGDAGRPQLGDATHRRAPLDHYLGVQPLGREGGGARGLGPGWKRVLDRRLPAGGARARRARRHHLRHGYRHRSRGP